ncbi:MAG TPA: hypothetical protein DD641_09400 [Deltaproteobacteria bacterium]|nr:hypothetical protein [Deltaproteobacteria bacterium]
MKFNLLRYILLFTGILIISCARNIHGGVVSSQGIKVLIFKDIKEISITGTNAIDAGGLIIETLNGKAVITLEEQNIITVNGTRTGGGNHPVRFSPRSGILYVNNRPFRGEIEVAAGDKGFLVINDLDIEMYLVGLINHEISSKWHTEVIKAQSVIARTYALHQKKKNIRNIYHLEGTVMGQVYSGSITEDETALEAVQDTAGEVLTYNGELALAVYHSNAGGYTEASKNVWQKDYLYLQSVESPYDILSPGFDWELTVSSFDLLNALKNAGYKVGEIEGIVPVEKTSTGRITKLRLIHKGGKLEMTGEELRRIIGYDRLKSTRFEIRHILAGGEDREVKSFNFTGRGSGHGVGLSQWGAKGMAEDGYSYKEILKHYYKGVEVVKIY